MKKQHDAIIDGFRGALLGCAIGDALGMPLEGMFPGQIEREHQKVTGFVEGPAGTGKVGDDTQMAISIAQSVIEIGRFDKAHAAFKLARWIENSDAGKRVAHGVNGELADVCRNLAAGTPAEVAAIRSNECSASARSVPVALRYFHDRPAMMDAAAGQARLTYSDPEAIAGAVAVSHAIAEGLGDDGGLNRREFLTTLASTVREVHRATASRIEGLIKYVEGNPSVALNYTGNSGRTIEAVSAALFAFLRTPYDFETTVFFCANNGGKADSITAIAGAISGAFNGASSIPDELKGAVEGGRYLQGLADKLFSLTPAAKPPRRPLSPGSGT